MVEIQETEEFNLSSKILLLAEQCDNARPPVKFNGYYKAIGPCGDTVEIWLKIQNDTVLDASCKVSGCIPSKACAMAAVTLAKGKKITDALAINARNILDYIQELPNESEHCAQLAAETLELAIKEYLTSLDSKEE